MNYRGSYRHLLNNAKAAMLAAIEVYNKPRFAYRDECFVILVLNAWELIFKALLSKNGKSVFYPKKRKQPYRTLSWQDALSRGESVFPKTMPLLPVRRNLDLLSTYRDNAVHFYNAQGFGSIVYTLAQTSVMNFRDVLHDAFNVKLEEDITWQLLPLGIKPPIDPIAYMVKKQEDAEKVEPAVKQFLAEIAAATKEIEEANADTGRFMTIFKVKLESIKKIAAADVIVGVASADQVSGPLVVSRTMDPNITHPLRQTEVVEKVGTLHDRAFTAHVFQAVAWKYQIKAKPELCWQATEGILTKYSNEVVAWVKRLSANDISGAIADYREHLRARQKAKKQG